MTAIDVDRAVRRAPALAATLRSLALMLWFAAVNVVTRRRVVAPSTDGPVVSLTTHGRRTDLVFLAIESIGRGTVRPARLVLWLDDPARLEAPPSALRRLVRRGLEIRPSENLGPHTKYFPAALATPAHAVPVVTADDDWMVPRRWLEEILRASRRSPGAVIAHRAHRIRMHGVGLAPYGTWGAATERAPSVLHFGTGCMGQLLPPALLDRLRDEGTAFREVTPRNDDVWIHHTAVELGLAVRPVLTLPESSFVPIRGGGGGRFGGLLGLGGVAPLFEANVAGGGNDVQIAATYSPASLARLAAAAAAAAEPASVAGPAPPRASVHG